VQRKRRIVSVTRLALQRDKRTFQNAASFVGMGYDSTVLEGEPSQLDREELPFELVTIEGAEPLGEAEPDAEEPPPPSEQDSSGRRTYPVLTRIGAARIRLKEQLGLLHLLWVSYRRDDARTFESLPPADLYYLTFFWQYPAVRRKCRETGARFIYDANDAYWLWPGYQWYPRPFRIWLRFIERLCVRRAAAFITVSDGVADLLERRYGRRPQVVRNMHDLRMDEPAELDVRRGAGVDNGAFLLVIVGNEKPSDAVDEALVALTRLPEGVHLALLGSGYEQHAARIRELGLEQRVHVFPPVPPTQVTSAIQSADAGLINIRAREVHMHALPTRLFSTIAAGLPLLHPPLPEVRALAEQYGLGPPVDAEDPDSIAAAVRRLVDNPELAADYRAKAQRAKEALNWESEERLLAQIVRPVLDGSAERVPARVS
jgi:glycosyltransferase involved in cell wall biosynthesis